MNGRKALITGSSRGIGRAIAIALAQDCDEVFVHCAGNREAAREVQSVIESNGGKATIVQGDLTDLSSAKRIYDETGDVDILVLNVSVQIRRPWREITAEEAQQQINSNFLSTMLLIQLYEPYMRLNKWGRIVAIGSVQEKKPHPDMLIYSSMKAAQTKMVESLALQLAGEGIAVNSVAPGVIYTDRNKTVLADVEYAKKVTASIPMGYYGMPEDCAGIVRLLCSDEGRYITGQSIYVDGGKSIQ